MHLVVLYDAQCAACVRCRAFVESSRSLVPVRFVDCRSAEARRRYGDIPFLVHELVVVDDAGGWWAGPAAFVMTLWALDSTRELAEWLLSPMLSGLATWAFAAVSANRVLLGSIFGLPACEGSACSAPHLAPSTVYR